jgi:cullin-associated NEDD8-dissociated protein 1
LDRLIEPLKNTCLQKIKSNAVKQEYEKNDELKRSALRAISALMQITDAEKNTQMRDFYASIRATPELAHMLTQQDNTNGLININNHDQMDIN